VREADYIEPITSQHSLYKIDRLFKTRVGS